MSADKHLSKKTYLGVFWTLVDVIFSKGIPLVVIIILARILGPEEFGLYGILVVFAAVGALLSEIGLTTFRQLIQGTFFINTPVILIIACVAKPIFLLVLGKDWLPAVPYFQILCLGGIFYPHHAYNLNILKVKGRSDLFLKLEVIKKILMVVIILISAPFGILGLLWGMVATSVLMLYINIHYSGRYMGYSFKQQIADLLPNMLIGLFCFLLTRYLCQQFQSFSDLLQIVFAAGIGLLGYLVCNIFFNRAEFIRYLNLIRKR